MCVCLKLFQGLTAFLDWQGYTLKPLVVFGLPDTMIRIWELMPDVEVMINNIRWRWGKPPSTRVWVDSGGYQIMVKGIAIGVEEIIRRYRELDGDIFIALDIPPRSLCAESWELIQQNIRNFEILYERLEGKNIVPVVHCYESDLLLYTIDTYRGYNMKMLAYGGAVPPSMAKMGKGSRTIPLLALTIVRKIFSGWLHALGIGGASAIYKALSIIGVNSLDSSSWRTKAAYGKVMIPGLGERYVGNGRAKFGRKDLSEYDMNVLRQALEKTGFPYIDKLADMLKTFRGRALVNAWVMRHFIDVIYSNNGFGWIVKYATKYSQMNLEELTTMLDKRLSRVKHYNT